MLKCLIRMRWLQEGVWGEAMLLREDMCMFDV